MLRRRRRDRRTLHRGLYRLPLDKKPGEYTYLTVGAPYVEKSGPLRCGHPQRERLKRELPFRDLPEGCRHLVLDAYRELWGL